MARFMRVLIAILMSVLISSINFSGLSYADDLPPSLPRPEGIGVIGTIDGNPIYGPVGGGNNSSGELSGSSNSTTWFPGMQDSNGTIIPPPLYNPDGTPYVEGVSPRPILPAKGNPIDDVTVEWFPGMKDPSGNEIPAPIFNLDGTLYVDGVSPKPRIPVYESSKLESTFTELGKITDKILVAKINSEIKSNGIELKKSKNTYVLNFEQNISALDSALYLSAINKKSKKTTKIEIKIDNNGQAVAPTKIDLSKYNVFLKRGKATLKKISVNN
jgi:hypothetical protein